MQQKMSIFEEYKNILLDSTIRKHESINYVITLNKNCYHVIFNRFYLCYDKDYDNL